MAEVAFLVFASVITTLPPLPVFHDVNNNYSNEPLGFGRV